MSAVLTPTRTPGPSATDRDFRILPVRTPAMLDAYAQPLNAAVADFHRRSRGAVRVSPEVFYARLFAIPESPYAALWLAVSGTYRLLGFAVASVGTDVFGVRLATWDACYLWPKRRSLAVAPAMVETVERWARHHGAVAVLFGTRRDRPRAWRRLGYTATAVLWRKEL